MMSVRLHHIQLLQGDITDAKVDGIVNAANPMLTGGGGVDGAIHRAAGESLLQSCMEMPVMDGIRCPPGEAKLTPAGELNASCVIHTVGPIYHDDESSAGVLEQCYRNVLEIALSCMLVTLAFPAISCGVYGYPPEKTARIALRVCSEERYQKLAITFYLLDAEIYQSWQQVKSELEQGAP